MADLNLKTRQGFWETPRNLALIVAAVAGVAGVLGYKLGSAPQQIIVHLDGARDNGGVLIVPKP